jgi:hypothetical protein
VGRNSYLTNQLDVCSFATVSVRSMRDSDRNDGPAVAYVPFDFVVGEILLPAGAYEVEPSGVLGMLMLRRAGSDSQPVLLQAINLDQRRRVIPEKLLFYCQQNLYFLAQAFTAPN